MAASTGDATGDAAASVAEIALLETRFAVGGKPTAYVWRGITCERPVTDAGELEQLLGGAEEA